MINDYLNALNADLKGFLPHLKTVETHGGRFDLAELKRYATGAPGLFVTVLDLNSSPVGDGQVDTALNMAAFIVTRDSRGLSRHAAALNIVEALCARIPDYNFNSNRVFGASNVRARNLYSSAVDKSAVALWAVTWTQPMRMGESIYAPEGALLRELYVGPDVDDLSKYAKVGGAEQ